MRRMYPGDSENWAAGDGLRMVRDDVIDAMENLGVKPDAVATVAGLVALRLSGYGHRERWLVGSWIVSREDRDKLGPFPAGPVFLVQDDWGESARVVTLEEMAAEDWSASASHQRIERIQ